MPKALDAMKRMLNKMKGRRRLWSLEMGDKGFLVVQDNPREIVRSVSWSDIHKVVAYKKDLFAVDMICFAIATSDGTAVEINEEMSGWANLVERLPKEIPGFPNQEQWFEKVAFPAFATNATTLYENQASA